MINSSFPSDNKFDLTITNNNHIFLQLGGKNYKIKFSNINYYDIVDLKTKLTVLFTDLFTQVNLNKGELSNISVWENKGNIQVKVIQKNENSQTESVKVVQLRNLFSSLYNEKKNEDVHTPLLEVKVKENTLLESIGKVFLGIIELLFGKSTILTQDIVAEFKEIVNLLPNKIKQMILNQLNKVSENEKAFLTFLRTNIAFPEGKEDEMILEILKGGYVILEDNGKTFDEWSKLKNCQERISSHTSDDKQYSLRENIVKECLFSRKQVKNESGKPEVVTWFQLERYSTHLSQSLFHLWTYILYKMTGENQGPYGSSKYQESFPLRLTLKTHLAP